MANKIAATWATGMDTEAVVAYLNSASHRDADGKLRFGAFAHRDCSALLFDMIELSEPVSETEGRSRLITAIDLASKAPPVTANSILRSFNMLLAEYSALPDTEYVLASALSIRKTSGLAPVQIHHARISFERRLPNEFRAARMSLGRRVKDALYTDPPKDYMPIRIRLKARTTYDAAERAQYILDLFRAIYNWTYNRAQPTRISWGSRAPVNRIVSGPIHTLHLPSGEFATDTFWFEDTYRAPSKLQRIDEHLDVLKDSYQIVQRNLRPSSYRSSLEDCLVRYVRALDDRDWHAAYLKLWGVLEVLTDTAERPRYDRTIQRAAYVFKDHRYQKASLSVLRNHRNRIVHASASTREIESYLYQLKYCVEALFDFHLFAKRRFPSIHEAARFLSLPVAKHALETKRELAEFALLYRNYRDPGQDSQ